MSALFVSTSQSSTVIPAYQFKHQLRQSYCSDDELRMTNNDASHMSYTRKKPVEVLCRWLIHENQCQPPQSPILDHLKILIPWRWLWNWRWQWCKWWWWWLLDDVESHLKVRSPWWKDVEWAQALSSCTTGCNQTLYCCALHLCSLHFPQL